MQIASFVALASLLSCGLVSGLVVPSEDYKQCTGKFKSPIDVHILNVQTREFPDMEIFNINILPESVHMINTGYSVVITMDFEEGREPSVLGGPMERKFSYRFEQFQFYWGHNDTVVMEGALPLELHMILRSMKYENYESAMGQDNAIAVLTFSFRLATMDNIHLDEFVHKISRIKSEGLTVDLEQPVAIEKILPWNLINYYSYIGSMIMPPCEQKVIWIDFQDSIFISEEQFNYLRELDDYDDHLMSNYQPTHAVKDPIIYKNVPQMTEFANGYHYNPFTMAPDPNSCNQCRKQSFLVVILVICAPFVWSKY